MFGKRLWPSPLAHGGTCYAHRRISLNDVSRENERLRWMISSARKIRAKLHMRNCRDVKWAWIFLMLRESLCSGLTILHVDV
ncbi:hypothetical protein GOP47_0008464 [Adiantum capillus-veneris]|uniref:Uncharacterized protein n=1 Tax=Adiantum capillus-veneris TaxID=13818 RepID=A0A9D4UYL6_ADICA|nr:hypothetical protein GOP47_0008464 [Adiantum capillus-veneris]